MGRLPLGNGRLPHCFARTGAVAEDNDGAREHATRSLRSVFSQTRATKSITQDETPPLPRE